MNVSDLFLLLLVFLFHSHSIMFFTMSTEGFNPVIYFSFIHLSRFVYVHMYTCLLQWLTNGSWNSLGNVQNPRYCRAIDIIGIDIIDYVTGI